MPELVCNASVSYKIMADSMYGHCNLLRLIWERDLNSYIEEEAWDEVVSNAGRPVRDVIEGSKFTHYKVIHKYYYTSLKLHKMGLIRDNMCWKCI